MQIRLTYRLCISCTTVCFRLCEENGVLNSTWEHSPFKRNTIAISGHGISSIKQQITDAIRKELQSCTHELEFIDSDGIQEHLSGSIGKWTTTTEDRLQTTAENFWNPTGERASCELVVEGKQVNKHSRPGTYAVTSAHLLLGKEVEKTLRATLKSEDVHQVVKGQLKNLNANIYREMYKLHITAESEKLCDLSYPPLACYQFYQRQNLLKKHIKFVNDIALFPIESDCFGSLGSHGRCKIVPNVTSDRLKEMAQKRTKVYVKDRSGIAVPMREAVRQNQKIGYLLAFTLDDK